MKKYSAETIGRDKLDIPLFSLDFKLDEDCVYDENTSIKCDPNISKASLNFQYQSRSYYLSATHYSGKDIHGEPAETYRFEFYNVEKPLEGMLLMAIGFRLIVQQLFRSESSLEAVPLQWVGATSEIRKIGKRDTFPPGFGSLAYVNMIKQLSFYANQKGEFEHLISCESGAGNLSQEKWNQVFLPIIQHYQYQPSQPGYSWSKKYLPSQ